MALEKNFSGKTHCPEAVNEIEFRDVSFAYENGQPVLEHISFTVRAGDKIAIVGENGAGKTTLMKLLCGLYEPTSGQILVNGVELSTLDREEYFDLVGGVFQDYTLLPGTLLDNIAMSQNGDRTKAEAILKKIGLWERFERLQYGLDTKLHKQMDEEAVELSGGEAQQLLLSRVLYKDAPVLLLDEPTAALDPLAEERLYLQYSDIAQNRISFFTSHRLTSTRFCDCIFLMDHGRITERGSHQELMRQKKKYWTMYKLQGFYYQEEAERA